MILRHELLKCGLKVRYVRHKSDDTFVSVNNFLKKKNFYRRDSKKVEITSPTVRTNNTTIYSNNDSYWKAICGKLKNLSAHAHWKEFWGVVDDIKKIHDSPPVLLYNAVLKGISDMSPKTQNGCDLAFKLVEEIMRKQSKLDMETIKILGFIVADSGHFSYLVRFRKILEDNLDDSEKDYCELYFNGIGIRCMLREGRYEQALQYFDESLIVLKRHYNMKDILKELPSRYMISTAYQRCDMDTVMRLNKVFRDILGPDPNLYHKYLATSIILDNYPSTKYFYKLITKERPDLISQKTYKYMLHIFSRNNDVDLTMDIINNHIKHEEGQRSEATLALRAYIVPSLRLKDIWLIVNSFIQKGFVINQSDIQFLNSLYSQSDRMNQSEFFANIEDLDDRCIKLYIDNMFQFHGAKRRIKGVLEILELVSRMGCWNLCDGDTFSILFNIMSRNHASATSNVLFDHICATSDSTTRLSEKDYYSIIKCQLNDFDYSEMYYYLYRYVSEFGEVSSRIAQILYEKAVSVKDEITLTLLTDLDIFLKKHDLPWTEDNLQMLQSIFNKTDIDFSVRAERQLKYPVSDTKNAELLSRLLRQNK